MKNGIRIVVSLLLLTMVGCSAVEKVENRAVMSANNYTERVVAVDSVVVRDSVFIREKADTVFFTKYRTLYKERLRVDTVICRDTLFVEKEILVDKARNGGKKYAIVCVPLLLCLLLLVLWRTGALRFMWNFIVKVVGVCIRVFRSKE